MLRNDRFSAGEVFIPRGRPLPEFNGTGVKVWDHFVGKGYAKTFHMPAGTSIGQHTHKIGHHATLMVGRVVLDSGGSFKTLVAPATVWIPAGEAHVIVAAEDSLWACLWDNPQRLLDAESFEKTVIA